jgi:hypothetical protein
MSKKWRELTEMHLPEELSEALLTTVVSSLDGEQVSLWQHLQRVQEELQNTVQKIDEVLGENPLVPLLARDHGRKVGFKRPQIRVSDDGQLWICEGKAPKPPKPEVLILPTRKKKKRKRKVSKDPLPLMGALRKMAAELGVSIAHMGRNRRLIYEFLKTVRQRLAAGYEVEDIQAEMEVKTAVEESFPESYLEMQDEDEEEEFGEEISAGVPEKVEEAPESPPSVPSLGSLVQKVVERAGPSKGPETAVAEVDLADLLADVEKAEEGGFTPPPPPVKVVRRSGGKRTRGGKMGRILEKAATMDLDAELANIDADLRRKETGTLQNNFDERALDRILKE